MITKIHFEIKFPKCYERQVAGMVHTGLVVVLANLKFSGFVESALRQFRIIRKDMP